MGYHALDRDAARLLLGRKRSGHGVESGNGKNKNKQLSSINA